jgi:hypothetical protein
VRVHTSITRFTMSFACQGLRAPTQPLFTEPACSLRLLPVLSLVNLLDTWIITPNTPPAGRR